MATPKKLVIIPDDKTQLPLVMWIETDRPFVPDVEAAVEWEWVNAPLGAELELRMIEAVRRAAGDPDLCPEWASQHRKVTVSVHGCYTPSPRSKYRTVVIEVNVMDSRPGPFLGGGHYLCTGVAFDAGVEDPNPRYRWFPRQRYAPSYVDDDGRRVDICLVEYERK